MSKTSIPVFIGFLFSAIGLATLVLSGEGLTAAIWLSFGNGLILTGLRFKQRNELGEGVYTPVPKARVYAGYFLIALAVLLLITQIIYDVLKGSEASAL